MKIFLDAETGSGKTSTLVIQCRLYRQLYPHRHIYANFHLKNVPYFTYSPFMFLPLSTIMEGKCFLCFDDSYVFKGVLDHYISLLSVFSRKLKIDTTFTIQYYTMLSRENRALCHQKWIPLTTHIKNDKMTEKSEIIIEVQKPISEKTLGFFRIKHPLKLVNNFYDTNEIPLFPNETNIINNLVKYSHDISDIEFNAKICSTNQRDKMRRIKEVCKLKGIEYKR